MSKERARLFYDQVVEMRKAQKDYERSRNSLTQARKDIYERLIDAEIDRVQRILNEQ